MPSRVGNSAEQLWGLSASVINTATVKWFIAQWLGLAATESRVDGASAALLENGWTAPATDSELSAVLDAVTDLRIQAAYQHRLHRPVWETQLRGVPVALLSEEEVHPANGIPAFTLADILADASSVVDEVTLELLKGQMHEVLRTLPERERDVIVARFSGVTKKDIMQRFGITRYRLDQIESDAFLRLRHPSRTVVLRDFLD